MLHMSRQACLWGTIDVFLSFDKNSPLKVKLRQLFRSSYDGNGLTRSASRLATANPCPSLSRKSSQKSRIRLRQVGGNSLWNSSQGSC
jgi:hypothetical protein